MRKLKILEIIPHFPFVRSFIGDRAEYMENHDIDMHIICNFDPDINKYAKNYTFKIHSLPFKRMPSLIEDIKAFFKISNYIRSNDIDVIVGHMIKGRLMAVILGIILKKKVLIWAHGTNFETASFLQRSLFIGLDKFESFFSVKVICVSSFVAEIRRKKHIDVLSKQFIPGHGSCKGVDCDFEFNPKLICNEEKTKLRKELNIIDGDKVIGFCGRITRDKGIEELVKAYEIVKQNIDKVKLLLVGDADIRDCISIETQKIIDEDESIIKTGFVKENIQLYYSLMDIFVLPTYRDGFGMCLIEAASLGIPVLTTNITGSRDAICNGFNGFYIDLLPIDIANKISILLLDDSLREKFGVNGRKWVETNFKQSKVFENLTIEYKTL